MELEKLAREFQQSQSDLCSRVHSVSDSLLQMSRDVRDMTVEASRSEKISSPVANPSHHSANGHAPGHAGHVGHSGHGHEAFAASTPAPSTQFASLGVDDETLHALKRRLQSLGDVLVFTSDKFDACCASGHSIPPGAVRVRPRRCDHVFLVECLMPYWVGGLCPVCRCSFAYSRENDESDRCSSVSTSVSQRANVLSLRHEAWHLEKVDTREVMASLNFRGPKVLRDSEVMPAMHVVLVPLALAPVPLEFLAPWVEHLQAGIDHYDTMSRKNPDRCACPKTRRARTWWTHCNSVLANSQTWGQSRANRCTWIEEKALKDDGWTRWIMSKVLPSRDLKSFWAACMRFWVVKKRVTWCHRGSVSILFTQF